MTVLDTPLTALDGSALNPALLDGKAVLVVNVASRCGLTPQYAGLESLQRRFADRGFTVLGVPSNQFMGQEPGSPEQIAEFCSATYGVTFPMTDKVDVNGPGAHPVYRRLTETPDAAGEAGPVRWNFEKFLLAPDGEVVARFSPQMEPDAPELVGAIEALLSR